MSNIVVSAYFFPALSPALPQTAFFLQSTDAINWQTVAAWPYPSNGATLSFTNRVDTNVSVLLFRAGYQ